MKYTEINPLGDDEPVEVEPYVSPTPTRLFVTLTEYYDEHPALRPRCQAGPPPAAGRSRRVGLPQPTHAAGRARRAAPRPRGRRERRHVARSMASADPGDSEPPAAPWRWASEASWRSFVASIQARDFEREIARERWNGVAR